MPAVAESPSLPDKLVGKEELSHLFNVQLPTISLWVRKKKLPAPIKIGRRMYWRPDSLAAILGLGDTTDVGGSPLKAAPGSGPADKKGAKSR